MRRSAHLYAYTWHFRIRANSKCHRSGAQVRRHGWARQQLRWHGFVCLRRFGLIQTEQLFLKRTPLCLSPEVFSALLTVTYSNFLWISCSICLDSSSKRVKLFWNCRAAHSDAEGNSLKSCLFCLFPSKKQNKIESEALLTWKDSLILNQRGQVLSREWANHEVNINSSHTAGLQRPLVYCTEVTSRASDYSDDAWNATLVQ